MQSSPFCFTDALQLSTQKSHLNTVSPRTHLRQRHVGAPDNIENHAGRLVDGELQQRRDYRPDRCILRASLRVKVRGVDGGGEEEGGRVVQVSPAGGGGVCGCTQSVRRNVGDFLRSLLCSSSERRMTRAVRTPVVGWKDNSKAFTHQAALVRGREGGRDRGRVKDEMTTSFRSARQRYR